MDDDLASILCCACKKNITPPVVWHIRSIEALMPDLLDELHGRGAPTEMPIEDVLRILEEADGFACSAECALTRLHDLAKREPRILWWAHSTDLVTYETGVGFTVYGSDDDFENLAAILAAHAQAVGNSV